MADYNNPKTILSLEVDYAQAVEGVQKLQKEIQRLKDEQDRLKDVSPVKDGIAAYEEAQKQLIINNERIKEYQYNVRALSKEIQNNARIQKANNEERTDSLNSLRASLSILTRQYDELGRS